MRSRLTAVLTCSLSCALILAVPAHAAFPGHNGKIAYSHDCDIWTIQPNGTGATQLTTSGAECDSEPAWSRDGEQIAFVRGTPGGNISTYAVHVMDADGGTCIPSCRERWGRHGRRTGPGSHSHRATRWERAPRTEPTSNT